MCSGGKKLYKECERSRFLIYATSPTTRTLIGADFKSNISCFQWKEIKIWKNVRKRKNKLRLPFALNLLFGYFIPSSSFLCTLSISRRIHSPQRRFLCFVEKLLKWKTLIGSLRDEREIFFDDIEERLNDRSAHNYSRLKWIIFLVDSQTLNLYVARRKCDKQQSLWLLWIKFIIIILYRLSYLRIFTTILTSSTATATDKVSSLKINNIFEILSLFIPPQNLPHLNSTLFSISSLCSPITFNIFT